MACTYLLVKSFAGHLPYVSIVPEGFEDADCVTVDGGRHWVQMKERGAGYGTLSRSEVLEAVIHASSRPGPIVIVTDGLLGGGLIDTGWQVGLSACLSSADLNEATTQLVRRNIESGDAVRLLERTHVVRLQHRLHEESEAVLVELGHHPLIASFTVRELTRLFAEAAADQRTTTAATAIHLSTGQVSAVLEQSREAVDPTTLSAAEVQGVCSTPDFSVRTASGSDFFAGVDGGPAHIAAGLDVRRTSELELCAQGLEQEGNVLIVGPSGSGKSVLLWRAARDLAPHARIVQVDSLRSSQEAYLLVQYCRLQRPTGTSPVLLVVDDLGRESRSYWPETARRLRQMHGILILSAARSEDFELSLLSSGPTRLIRLELASLFHEAG